MHPLDVLLAIAKVDPERCVDYARHLDPLTISSARRTMRRILQSTQPFVRLPNDPRPIGKGEESQ